MPGGVGGEAPRGAPLSRLTAIRLAEAQLAVPSGEALPTQTPNYPQFPPRNLNYYRLSSTPEEEAERARYQSERTFAV